MIHGGWNWLLCSVLGLSLSGASRLSASEKPTTPAVNPRQAVTVLIRQGDPIGSGVVVRRDPQGFWVVTNRHVLAGLQAVCVETADGLRRPGATLPNQTPEVDLALLWIAAAEQLPSVATFSNESPEAVAINFPVVVATGFPAVIDPTTQKPIYTEREGLLLPLLKGPIENGYLLTYTSQVAKGMSGGGIFNEKNQLIGINATHPEPLWDARLKDQLGRSIPNTLNRQLSLVSLGISFNEITNVLKTTGQPSAWSSNKEDNPCVSKH